MHLKSLNIPHSGLLIAQWSSSLHWPRHTTWCFGSAGVAVFSAPHIAVDGKNTSDHKVPRLEEWSRPGSPLQCAPRPWPSLYQGESSSFQCQNQHGPHHLHAFRTGCGTLMFKYLPRAQPPGLILRKRHSFVWNTCKGVTIYYFQNDQLSWLHFFCLYKNYFLTTQSQ